MENCSKCNKKITQEEYIENGGYCKNCIEEIEEDTIEEKKNTEYINSSNSSNAVANKFILVVNIVKFIGYIAAIILGLILIGQGIILLGILGAIIIAIITWFSTLMFEAIAEGLNLLQDIKNKL